MAICRFIYFRITTSYDNYLVIKEFVIANCGRMVEVVTSGSETLIKPTQYTLRLRLITNYLSPHTSEVL